jgi:DNA-binding transcriptional LysR family regulator
MLRLSTTLGSWVQSRVYKVAGTHHLSAREAGLGLAYLPTFISEPSLERKTLQAVLPNHWVNGPPVHLICPQPRHVPRRVRA